MTDRPDRRPTTPVRVHAIEGERVREQPDRLVTEEPMEIRVHGPGQEPRALAVTMRTPGADFELAVGYCYTEGVLSAPAALASVGYCLGGEGEQHYNVVTVKLRAPVDLDAHYRGTIASSSCGLCGKTTLDRIETGCRPVGDGPVVARSTIARLPDVLRAAQRVFDDTGALHAAGLFDVTGVLDVAREDVGRHNAVDKLIGHAIMHRSVPLSDRVLMVSGRLGFEIVQKAAMAGIPVVCAVSAPSSLAVDTARRFGQTVVGFVRGDRGNVYTSPERVDFDR